MAEADMSLFEFRERGAPRRVSEATEGNP
jgi:hypothetical protein